MPLNRGNSLFSHASLHSKMTNTFLGLSADLGVAHLYALFLSNSALYTLTLTYAGVSDRKTQ